MRFNIGDQIISSLSGSVLEITPTGTICVVAARPGSGFERLVGDTSRTRLDHNWPEHWSLYKPKSRSFTKLYQKLTN